MTFKNFNKATAAMLAGAATTIVGGFVNVDGEALGAAQTLLTALLVWLVPNRP
jgi:hypothetical protein